MSYLVEYRFYDTFHVLIVLIVRIAAFPLFLLL